MNESAEGFSAQPPPKRADVFLLNRLHSKWITGRWDRTLLRDIAVVVLFVVILVNFLLAMRLGTIGYHWQVIFDIFITVLALLFISTAIVVWSKTRRYRRRGTLIYGHIEWCYGELKMWGEDWTYMLRVHYEFASPMGNTISSSKQTPRFDLYLWNKPLPPPGTP